MEREVKIKGIYRHYKGDYYIVEDIALDSGTLKRLVIYRALYENSQLWVREEEEFLEFVDQENQKYRFELQEITSKR